MLIVPEEPDGETLEVPVLKVFDGDGFVTRISSPRQDRDFEATVRFGFIDAPELQQPGGSEAKDFLTHLIGGKRLELAILLKMDTGKIVDRHDRIVAVPYLREVPPPASSQTWTARRPAAHFDPRCRNVELEMVINGWAWVLDRYGPDERYFVALEDAQRHRRGIWARDDNEHPWEFKKRRYRNTGRPHSGQPMLFDTANSSPCCPTERCPGVLQERNGKFGPFLGCSEFPKCRYSKAI